MIKRAYLERASQPIAMASPPATVTPMVEAAASQSTEPAVTQHMIDVIPPVTPPNLGPVKNRFTIVSVEDSATHGRYAIPGSQYVVTVGTDGVTLTATEDSAALTDARQMQGGFACIDDRKKKKLLITLTPLTEIEIEPEEVSDTTAKIEETSERKE